MKQFSLKIFNDAELLPLLFTCAAVSLFLYLLFRKKGWLKKEDTVETKQNAFPHLSFLKTTEKRRKWTSSDWFWVLLISINYGIVSFWQLGSSVFPSTTWQPVKDTQGFILELTEDTHFDSVYAIFDEGDNNSNPDSLQIGWNSIILEGSDDLNTWNEITTLSDGSLYQYKITDGDFNYRYIRVTSTNKNNTLTELGFKKYGKEELLPVKVYEDDEIASRWPAALVIDEQNKISLDPTYMNESYFDEVYHPRNAWEIANHEFMYAHVHPLLGTELIALSIKLLGMNPLAWRIPGVITGILLLPVFYEILNLLFRKREYAALGTAFLASDFMHLTTSRIATLEPFSVFWILMMFLFMIRYYKTSFYDTDFRKTLKLLLWCGICMGLGIATKWTACYSAIGLAILLFTNLGKRCSEYKRAVKILRSNPSAEEYTMDELSMCRYIESWWKDYFWKTIAWCFLFFIGIPLVIYFAVYIPCPVWRDGWSISNVLDQIDYMYNYHIHLKATHPYQSYWYEWIIDARPIWYYGRANRHGTYNSIACFTNPLLSFAGLIAIVYVIMDVITDFMHRKAENAYIIAVGYLTAFLPWVIFVKRCVFAYHFYPTSFFMILAIVYVMKKLMESDPKWKKPVLIYTIACIILFFAFLPATAGFETNNSYIKALEWLPRWYFG